MLRIFLYKKTNSFEDNHLSLDNPWLSAETDLDLEDDDADEEELLLESSLML